VTDKIMPRLRKSRHNLCVRPKVQQPYPKITSRLHKSRHNFAFSRNHTFCQQNRCTFLGFTASQFEDKFNISPPWL